MIETTFRSFSLVVLLATAATASEVSWLTNWEEAVTASRAQRKPIFVDVFTTWCPPCKQLDAETFSDKQFATLAADVVLLKQDAEKGGRELAKRYGVRGYPTLLLLDADGKLMARMVGFQPPDRLVRQTRRLIELSARLPKIEAGLKQRPTDPQLNMQLAELLFARDRSMEALKIVETLDKAAVREPAMAPLCLRAARTLFEQTPPVEQQQPVLERIANLLKKADTLAKDVYVAAEAKLMLAQSHMIRGELDVAQDYARAVTALDDAPPHMRDFARQLLRSLK